MSRIIVKNLPSKANEADVRKHFEPKGRITDVKVMRKRDGSSRRFAFVGFTSDEEAEEAARFFNLSFMLSSRLDVSLAKSLGDETLEKRKETLKRKRLDQKEVGDIKQKEKRSDPKNEKLQEFLSVMQPQGKTAMWKNDSTEQSVKPNSQRSKDDDDVVDLTELQKRHLKEQQEHVDFRDYEEPLHQDNEPNDEPMGEETTSENKNDDDFMKEEDWVPRVTEEEESKPVDSGMSDLEWLRQRQTRIKENGDKPEIELEEEEIEKEHEENQDDMKVDENPLNTEDMEQTEQARPATNRLFLRNLAFTVTRTDLEKLFKPFGNLKQVHIPVDPRTDKPKGIAFVEFAEVEEAIEALQELDGKSFQGRLLHIIFGEEQRSYQLDEFDIKNMPLKKQKALKRRMQAAKQQFSWNSLYMNKDTVLEAAAAKLGLTKSQIMDPTSSNMAVKQALAESSVLESVQSYFKSKGVDLSKFRTGRSQELSDTVILAKNLPYQMSALELQDMFAVHGEVARTLMPPDGGIAIVQYKLASAGRSAFQKLAFRRVGDSILYLQKAPKGTLDESVISTNDATADTAEDTTKLAAATAKDMLLPEDNTSVINDADVRTSVFVKNLNFSTQVAALAKLFQAIPGYITATIKQKPDPQHPGRQLSMGFGFVEFRTLSQAETAVKTLQGHDLDGHGLQLKISSRGETRQTTAKAPVTSKIVIKNIPFETSKKDIVDLFGTFGQLRSVRVPRKFNRQTRGFAFAEFATPKEAEHAMASLQGAHLLGRRLVMDYAEADAEDPETEIARMEAKVAKQVSAEDIHGRKLGGQQKGFDMENLDE